MGEMYASIGRAAQRLAAKANGVPRTVQPRRAGEESAWQKPCRARNRTTGRTHARSRRAALGEKVTAPVRAEARL